MEQALQQRKSRGMEQGGGQKVIGRCANIWLQVSQRMNLSNIFLSLQTISWTQAATFVGTRHGDRKQFLAEKSDFELN